MVTFNSDTTPNTIESSIDMCMRPTYKSPNNLELLVESHDNHILPVIEYTTIGNTEHLHPFVADPEDTPGIDEKDYDFYCDDKADSEKVLLYDEEKTELIKQEKYCDSHEFKFQKAYKDEMHEEDLWILPDSELNQQERSKLWTKRRIVSTMAMLYTLCLGASYLYFYHGSICM